MISEQEWVEFLEHCFYGDISEVKEALNNHILENINYEHFFEIVDCLEFERGRTWQLIKNRIDRNVKFIDAIIKHDEESVKKFIRYNNIDINTLNFGSEFEGYTFKSRPILYATDSFYGDININILRSLLNSKQRIRQEDIQESLLFCVSQNSFEGVTLLLEYGADINYILEGGERALGIAISYGNIEMVKFLLSKGADILANDYDSFLDLEKLSREATGTRTLREIPLFEIDAFIDYLSSKKYNEALEEFKYLVHEDEYEVIQVRAKNIHQHFLATIEHNIEKLLTEQYSFKVDDDQDSIGVIDSRFDPETSFQELTYSDLLGLDFEEYLTPNSIHSTFQLDDYTDGI